MRPDRAERLHHEPVAAGLAERAVERPVGLEGVGATRGELGQAIDLGALLVARPRGCERGGGGLEQLAQLVELAHVGCREAHDERAAARHEPHEALALEQMQRLAHGRARHAQLGRDLLLLDARVGRQPPARDRLAQRGVHPVGELLLIVEGCERHVADTVSKNWWWCWESDPRLPLAPRAERARTSRVRTPSVARSL